MTTNPTTKNQKLNTRQHRFCLNILAGMRPQEAFVQAGYTNSPGNVAVTPYQLLENPSVSSFIESKTRLKEAAVLAADINSTIASPLERKQILTELARARLVDFQDASGEPTLNKDTPNNRAAKDYSHRRRFDGAGNPIVTKSIKLTDQIAAIQELNKMDGSYAPQKHLVGHVQFEVEFVDRKDRELPEGEE